MVFKWVFFIKEMKIDSHKYNSVLEENVARRFESASSVKVERIEGFNLYGKLI